MKTILTSLLLIIVANVCAQDLIRKTITAENAAAIKTFDADDIESMVTYYFASRIRKDNQWLEVLPDSTEWSSRMAYAINRHNQWNFVEFKNLGIYTGKYGGTYVKVYFVIEMEGRRDGGEDDVELKKVNDKWVIARVPI